VQATRRRYPAGAYQIAGVAGGLRGMQSSLEATCNYNNYKQLSH
jgi:hypothetical protein